MEKIGYLGPKGTFSNIAVLKCADEENIIAFPTIADVIYAVNAGEIDKGVVPIENSLEGSVNETLDMLIFQTDVKILGEFDVDIQNNLLVKKGTKIEDVGEVFSHPQPIGQCKKFLYENFSTKKIITTSSTAEAARIVSENEGCCAAIGNVLAAKHYNLEIIARSIQDNKSNTTRFILIGKEEAKRIEQKYKTSIVFSTENNPGSLYKILSIFMIHDINMIKILSRPSKQKLGEYIFLVDVEGHKEDEDMKDVLKTLKRKATFFKMLGSYSCVK